MASICAILLTCASFRWLCQTRDTGLHCSTHRFILLEIHNERMHGAEEELLSNIHHLGYTETIERMHKKNITYLLLFVYLL